jgi:hypothetical protein
MSDFKTSLLVNRQVPEFIREEYPLFITFLEAYYEYLETQQGTEKNDLVKKSKDLRNLPDVDLSIEEFQNSFFNMYASLVPQDVAVNKEVLIKNVLPLYLSKGSENSFKLLFRLLFGQELQLSYPRSEVLRASDGKWLIEDYLKVSNTVYSLHIGDGTTKEFVLAPCRCPITGGVLPIRADVYIDDVLQTSGFFIRSESKKLYFNTAPVDGAEIKVYYLGFDFSQIVSRKVTGVTSNASALVQRIGSQVINNQNVNEFYVDKSSIRGTFSIGEQIRTDVFGVDGNLINIYFSGLSSVLSVNIIDGGSNYQVGDSVIINAPEAVEQPKAIISKVFSGKINQVNILNGGAGFQAPSRVFADGFSNSEIEFAIAAVETSTANAVSNTFFIYSDVISDIDPANTTIDTADYNFPGNISPLGVVNANSIVSHAFSNIAYTLIGGISNVAIITANVIVSSLPVLGADPATVTINPLTANTSAQTVVAIDTFGSVGKLFIRFTGTNYEVGDELIFTNPKNKMAIGVGASGEVSNVSTIGEITEVILLPPKITGTANVYSLSNTTVQGNNTIFLEELIPGDLITIRTGNSGISAYETRKVVAVDSNTSINVNTAFSNSFVTDRAIRKVGVYPTGGQGYRPETLPTITISSANGTSALIEAVAIMGDGEKLEGIGTKRPGEIEEIEITNPGSGIRIIPQVDLTQSGDGTALANVSLAPTFDSLPGRWTSSDGILSSDRRLQGRDFYVNYSYLTSSVVEFSKYKKIFKELLHPAGFEAYATWDTFNVITQNTSTLSTLVEPKNIRTLSGLVNVANASIFVTGVGTKFNVANTNGILSIGSYIAINSEIRVVNSIISNTNLEVTSAFTITANLEEMIVINTVYDAIATEVSLDEIVAENELVLTVEE